MAISVHRRTLQREHVRCSESSYMTPTGAAAEPVLLVAIPAQLRQRIRFAFPFLRRWVE